MQKPPAGEPANRVELVSLDELTRVVAGVVAASGACAGLLAIGQLAIGQLAMAQLAQSHDDGLRTLVFGEPGLLNPAAVDAAWGELSPRLNGTRLPAADFPHGSLLYSGPPKCGAWSLPIARGDQLLGLLVVCAKTQLLDEPSFRQTVDALGERLGLMLSLYREVGTARAQERAARYAHEQLDALLSAVPDTIVFLDLNGNLQHINRTRENAAMGGIVGRGWRDFVARSHQQVLAETIREVLSTREPRDCEVSVNDESATPLFYRCNIGPRIQDGETIGVVIIARDVSESKAAETQLLASDRMAVVGSLAASVGHEINNPLAAAIANLELALETYDDGRTEEEAEAVLCLRDASSALGRVRSIVRDLGTFARSDDDTPRPVDVIRVLDSTLRLTRNELAHRARVRRLYSPVPRVLATEGRLGQVVMNLLVNAAHAIGDGQVSDNEITVMARQLATGQVAIEICDTGSGIPPGLLDRIFLPFFSTKQEGQGTGLGLAISRKIVESFAGTLTVESVLGKGSAFTITLPAAETEVLMPSAISTPPPPAAPSRRGRLLVIDDEELVGTAVRRILTGSHAVVTLDNANDALEMLLEGTQFDLILCDLMMPEMSGAEFYRLLSREFPLLAPRVVFLSGGPFTPRAQEFLTEQSHQFLVKPFSPNELRTLVASRLNRPGKE